MPAPADDDLDRLRLKLAAGSCDGAAAPHEELRENFVAPVATAGGWRLGLARFERCCCPSSFDITKLAKCEDELVSLVESCCNTRLQKITHLFVSGPGTFGGIVNAL